MKKNILIILSILVSFANNIKASEFKIIAKVNGQIITSYDLDAKVKFAKEIIKIKKQKIKESELKDQVLDAMIKDKLILEEAAKYRIAPRKQDVERAIKYIEKQNGLKEGKYKKLIEEAGCDESICLEQIKADIVWSNFIKQFYSASINISDDEIQTELKKFKNKLAISNAKVNLSQMLLTEKSSVESMLKEFSKKEKACKQFNKKDETVNLGMMAFKDLAPQVQFIIADLEIGQISKPLGSPNGFLLFMVCEKKTTGDVKVPDDIEDRIRYSLFSQKSEVYANKHLEKLKAEAIIEKY